MPSKELIEKVARAIYERRHKGMKNIWSWDDCSLDDEHPGERERHIGYAEAAISTIRAALQELDANQEQIGFREAFDSFQMLDGEPFLQTDVAQRVFSAVLAASALGEQSE